MIASKDEASLSPHYSKQAYWLGVCCCCCCCCWRRRNLFRSLCRSRFLGRSGFVCDPCSEPADGALPAEPSCPEPPADPWAKPGRVATTKVASSSEQNGCHRLRLIGLDMSSLPGL